MSPSVYGPLTSPQTLGRDWHKHFDYGVTLLEQEIPDGKHRDNGMVFARAAFASAARFSRDYAPAYAGLGLTNLQLGYLTDAEEAFLNAGLMEDRSLYWALASLAALQQGDERLALAAFHLMQQAKIQDEDPVTHFVRGIYAVNGSQFNTPLVSVPLRPPAAPEDASTVCRNDSEEAQCRNLNVVVSVYFVRRSTSDTITRGTNFFNDLKLQLGAEGSISRATGDAESIISRSATLTIPDIQYAVRLTPMDSRTNLYLTAAPSVVTSIGKTSEIHQGSNLTILYNSEGYTNDYTAETGISLRIQPEEASSDAVKLLLDFELSSVAGLAPSMTAQVLNVSSNKYSIEGFFPYGRPVVLGTISSSSHQQKGDGQMGLRRLPLFGNTFGDSKEDTNSSDTLVLGYLEEPAAFRGSHEQQLLDMLRGRGLSIGAISSVRRRTQLYQAPDSTDFLIRFLKKRTQTD